jgi:hypothetical protein
MGAQNETSLRQRNNPNYAERTFYKKKTYILGQTWRYEHPHPEEYERNMTIL